MAFITEKEELKPGLVLFRRGDVEHRMWYCRMKLPKADRYKTVSLKTSDKETARERAFDQDADVRFRIKHDVPVFNRPFRNVAHEYLLTQEARAKRGEISAARPRKLRAVIEGTLDRYAGSTQVHLIGDERWGSYFFAEQMGTSVHMIESHYGHVNTIKHADCVLQGMAGWELPQTDDAKAKASKASETHDKSKRGQRHKPR